MSKPSSSSNDYVLVRLRRPEGYEDVHPDLILQDANINPAFEPELVAYSAEEKARAWDILCDVVRGYEVDSTRMYRLDEMAKALAATRTRGVDVPATPN